MSEISRAALSPGTIISTPVGNKLRVKIYASKVEKKCIQYIITRSSIANENSSTVSLENSILMMVI